MSCCVREQSSFCVLLTQGTASNVDQEQQQMVIQLQQQNQLMSQQLAQLQVQLSTSEQTVADLQGQHQAALSGLSALQAQHSMLSSQHAELQTQHEALDKAHAKRIADHESANGSLETQHAALMTQSTELQRQHAETVSSLNMLKGDHEALTRQNAGLQVCLIAPFIACTASLVVTNAFKVCSAHLAKPTGWHEVCLSAACQSFECHACLHALLAIMFLNPRLMCLCEQEVCTHATKQ